MMLLLSLPPAFVPSRPSSRDGKVEREKCQHYLAILILEVLLLRDDDNYCSCGLSLTCDGMTISKNALHKNIIEL